MDEKTTRESNMKCGHCNHETLHGEILYFNLSVDQDNPIWTKQEGTCEADGCRCNSFKTISEEQFLANKTYHEGKEPTHRSQKDAECVADGREAVSDYLRAKGRI